MSHFSYGCGRKNVWFSCFFISCVFCRDQLESEKKRREAIEMEKENMAKEKQELMMKLYEYEETTKRAERGENHMTH